MGQAPIELAIPLDVTAESDRDSICHNLDNPAQGITSFFACIDLFDDRAFGLGIGHPHRRLLGRRPQFGQARVVWSLCDRGADAYDVAQNVNSEWRDKLPGERADCNTSSGFPRRSAFEDVSDILEIVLQHPRQVGVTWTRPRNHFRLTPIARISRHPLLPTLEVAVDDDEGDRT